MTLSNGTRRVVVTGMGIVSCIGNTTDEVLASLKAGKSGITFAPEYAELGFRSHVHGKPEIDLEARIDRKMRRFMGDSAAYNHIAMEDAIADSGLEEKDIINERTGIVMGSGGPSTRTVVESARIAKESAPKRVGPYAVPKAMSSTNSANIATHFQIKGINYSITSACSTSAHCIGNAAEMIAWGKQDIIFAGGGEELDWSLSVLFDAMGAMSSKYNDTPTKASRAYDANRDGFVIAGGGGVLVLEELEHALARGAKIYAEVTGYGATSDGADMVAPSGEGAVRCMKQAMSTLKSPVTYINTHGTSTPVGDIRELEAIHEVFAGQDIPTISSTKSMTGHSLGATGVQEAIYSLLMMENNFICPSINIETPDEGIGNIPIAMKLIENVDHQSVMSNSFGFGGTNCTLAFSKYIKGA
ncbi:MAG: beta-ketoacyl-[acyl-carrier-protein] synthase I [Micavibrio sp.]|nr:beta-ketoacyl-[acyl-carrier-protein] synthase I [Micavibrio sp.]|tara:strand:+ start:226681 stop:227925 length:1245 start_codon:yes stop_codon:yes gene_type:complete